MIINIFTSIARQTLWGIITVQFILLVAGIGLLSTLLAAHSSSVVSETKEMRLVSGCKVTPTSYTVRGASMAPMINDGTEVNVLEHFYQCGGEVARGDTIIYTSASTGGPVIKTIRALPGDRIFMKDGVLNINGLPMMNSRWEPYRFSSAEEKMLSIYAENGILQKGAYFVFGDNTQNSMDSRKFGAVGIAGFIGKVVLSKAE